MLRAFEDQCALAVTAPPPAALAQVSCRINASSGADGDGQCLATVIQLGVWPWSLCDITSTTTGSMTC
ncbi:hypothetical protein CCO03_04055 [Comamonas serinivorans]|uniref:Uncharacterized protein n=1 Tax=Comamonas serinivorans TaxID=1082851 RepID=A0A1Y0EK54_9BURK|nr:hypothetical protein CCO03_04055 [Comamonas serinivorans]